mmetsp:Transcript_142372/g.248275  ORF Transcript_142372/g.248275 Transcript_142372/m.248275 type:complete len:216 (+) Transcript_142372:1607-2254(+)
MVPIYLVVHMAFALCVETEHVHIHIHVVVLLLRLVPTNSEAGHLHIWCHRNGLPRIKSKAPESTGDIFKGTFVAARIGMEDPIISRTLQMSKFHCGVFRVCDNVNGVPEDLCICLLIIQPDVCRPQRAEGLFLLLTFEDCDDEDQLCDKRSNVKQLYFHHLAIFGIGVRLCWYRSFTIFLWFLRLLYCLLHILALFLHHYGQVLVLAIVVVNKVT